MTASRYHHDKGKARHGTVLWAAKVFRTGRRMTWAERWAIMAGNCSNYAGEAEDDALGGGWGALHAESREMRWRARGYRCAARAITAHEAGQ